MDATSKGGVSKLVKAWEAKNTERSKRAAGLGLMAVSLAACGGSDDADVVTPPPPPPVEPKSFTLTIGEDAGAAFVGTSEGDTYNARAVQSNDGDIQPTLDSFDVLNGAGGADTLIATLGSGAAVAPTLVSIETLVLRGGDDTPAVTGTLSLAKSTGVTKIISQDSLSNLAIQDVGSIVSLEIAGLVGAETTSLTYVAAAVAGAADSQSLILSGNSSMGAIAVGAGIETVNITASGKNVGTSLTTGASTINIAGSGDLTFTSIPGAETVNASTATGKLTLTLAADGATITLGSGADSLTLSDVATTTLETAVNMGAGNDTLTLTSLDGAADLVDSKVTLAGGAGTDTIVMLNSLASELGGLSASNYAKKGITGFEKIVISDAGGVTTGVDFTTFGINDIEFENGIAAAASFTVDNNAKVTLSAGGTGNATIVVDGANDAGSTNDALVIALNGAHAAATTSVDYGAVTVANVETVTIASGNSTTANVTYTTANNVLDLVSTTASKVVVTGAMALDLSGAALTGTSTFDASAHTGESLTVSFAGGVAVTYTGSSGDDVVTGSGLADIISTGAGDDTITGGAGNDLITTGAGKDVYVAGAQTAAGIDKVTDFNFDSSDVIVFAAGQDVTDVRTADLSGAADLQAAAALAVTNAVAQVGLADNWNEAGDAILFSFGGKTYITINSTNTTDNFNTGLTSYSTSDALIEVTGFTGTFGASDLVATIPA